MKVINWIRKIADTWQYEVVVVLWGLFNIFSTNGVGHRGLGVFLLMLGTWGLGQRFQKWAILKNIPEGQELVGFVTADKDEDNA